MRTSRIIEMIYLLLNNRQQKAQDIADHFGVSTKTIYRDVETLAKAGVPVSMQQGIGGGIVLSENYAINKTKLTASEEAVLMKALDDIKKLPNAQLDYALKLLKQYFNEAGTLWVNTDDVSLDMQDKFHSVKAATIEKRVIEFEYYTGQKYKQYRVEPYELRLKGEIWTVLVRQIKTDSFEEVYLSRMKDIETKAKHFTRREIPDEFGKRYGGNVIEVCFEVVELTEEILNQFPIENFVFRDDQTLLNLKVKTHGDVLMIRRRFPELLYVKEVVDVK
jgi:predicted DNA-binding transcriptional regulator YafY